MRWAYVYPQNELVLHCWPPTRAKEMTNDVNQQLKLNKIISFDGLAEPPCVANQTSHKVD